MIETSVEYVLMKTSYLRARCAVRSRYCIVRSTKSPRTPGPGRAVVETTTRHGPDSLPSDNWALSSSRGGQNPVYRSCRVSDDGSGTLLSGPRPRRPRSRDIGLLYTREVMKLKQSAAFPSPSAMTSTQQCKANLSFLLRNSS